MLSTYKYKTTLRRESEKLATLINCRTDFNYETLLIANCECFLSSLTMAVIHLSKTDNKIYGQEGMCVN